MFAHFTTVAPKEKSGKKNEKTRDHCDTPSSNQVRLCLCRSRRGHGILKGVCVPWDSGFGSGLLDCFWTAHPRNRARALCVALVTASLRISRSSAKVRSRSTYRPTDRNMPNAPCRFRVPPGGRDHAPLTPLVWPTTVTDTHLAALSLLFDKHVVKAASIVDSHGVSSHEGKESGRLVYQVKSTGGDPYTVFPGHYCSCHSFFYDVVSRAEVVYCKHQLAVFLSDALGRTRRSKVPDKVVAEILESC